jgi:hypothetical protein
LKFTQIQEQAAIAKERLADIMTPRFDCDPPSLTGALLDDVWHLIAMIGPDYDVGISWGRVKLPCHGEPPAFIIIVSPKNAPPGVKRLRAGGKVGI